MIVGRFGGKLGDRAKTEPLVKADCLLIVLSHAPNNTMRLYPKAWKISTKKSIIILPKPVPW